MRKEVFQFIFLVVCMLVCTTAVQHIACPRISSSHYDTQLLGYDPVRPFTEVSGLVFSKTQTTPGGTEIIYAITDGTNNNGEDGRGRIGVFNSRTGRRLVTLALSNATGENWDWEALTLGACGPQFEPEETCIYVGDIGDNVAAASNGRRNDRKTTWPYRIIKIKEPNWENFNFTGVTAYFVRDSDVFILPYDYFHPSSPKNYANAEALFIDHTGWGQDGAIGDLYIATKWGVSNTDTNRLYKIPVQAWEQAPTSNPWTLDSGMVTVSRAEKKSNYDSTVTLSITIGEQPTTPETPQQSTSGTTGTRLNSTLDALDMGSAGGVTFLPLYQPEAVGSYPADSEFTQFVWTGADTTLDGRVISLSTPDTVVIYLRCPGESVADALTGFATPCTELSNPSERSGVETSAWTPDGYQYLQIPEGRRPRMGWADMDRSDTGGDNAKECPDEYVDRRSIWWD